MNLVRLLVWLLPASRLKNALLSLTPGWRVHPTARLAPSIVWGVRRADIGADVAVGPGNILRELAALRLGDRAEVGQLNYVTAATRFLPIASDAALRGQLVVGQGAGLTSRHYVDVSGGLEIGDFSVVGGVRSTLLSHSLDVRDNSQGLSAIRIREHSLVYSNAVILPGVIVGPRVTVAAGAVVTKDVTQENTLYGGTPARPVGHLRGAAFFGRTTHREGTRADEALVVRRSRLAER